MNLDIKVKVQASWAKENQKQVKNFLNYLCSEKCNNRWKNLLLVDYEDPDYDYEVIFNYPIFDGFDPSKTIVFHSEPSQTREVVNIFSEDRYNFQFCCGKEDEFFKVLYQDDLFCFDPAWKVWMPYLRLKRTNFEKYREFSALISDAEYTENHKERKSFILNHLYNIDNFIHYGRGNFDKHKCYRGEAMYVSEAYSPFKYTFSVERYTENNYFTEKIRDPIFCETLSFYNGCPNISDFIDPRCYININLFDTEETLHIINKSIEDKEWEKRIEFIRNEKIRLMDDLNPLNIIWSVINNEKIITFKDIKEDLNEENKIDIGI